MGSPRPPPPINVPATTAAGNQEFQSVATANQGQSATGYANPYQGINYSTTIDPLTGRPTLQQNTSLSGSEQPIFDIQQLNKLGIGGTAFGDIASNFGRYTQDPNLVGQANSLTNQVLSSQDPAWERFMAPARAQLDTQLRNQGIMPAAPGQPKGAYEQAVDNLTQQQLLTKGQWLGQFQPQAFGEAQQQFNTPLNVAALMMGLSPSAVGSNFNIPAPGYNQQPVDVPGLTVEAQQEQYRNYQQAVQRQNNMMAGIFGGLGGIARLPVTGGGSLGGNFVNNMFS